MPFLRSASRRRAPPVAGPVAGALAALLAGVALAGTGAPAPGAIEVVRAWSRPTPPGAEVGVVYFELRNGGAADRLLGASTAVAARAELHETRMADGMMSMEHVESVPVPARGRVEFRPNGLHVMLFGLKSPLVEGATYALRLRFEKAGPVDVTVRVAAQGDAAGAPAGR